MKKMYVLILALAGAGNVFSQNICESSSHQLYKAPSQSGNQIHKGELGMEFLVTNADGIIIKQLGAFDDNGDGIVGLQPGGGIRIAVFSRGLQTIIPGLDVTIAGLADAYTFGYRMKNITPVLLPPGDYVLVSKGYNDNERNGNIGIGGGPYPAGDDGGAITFGAESSYGPDDANGFNYPSTSGVYGNPQQYLAGTLSFTTTSNCALSNIATLSGPCFKRRHMTPSFVQGTTSYTASVNNSVTSVNITPSATNAGAAITVNGNTVASGNASNVALVEGDNTINVVITAQDGTTVQTYALIVTRLAATLPVILTNFSANLTADKKVAITWSTTQEINSANFDVQKSNDGIHWSTVANIPAAGTSYKQLDYKTTDPAPIKGANLYRIRMNDLDGKFAFTAVASVKVTVSGKLSLYPNPSADVVRVSLGEAAQSDWVVSVINNAGQVVLQNKFSKNAIAADLTVSKLPAGNYTLQITEGASKQISKLVISH